MLYRVFGRNGSGKTSYIFEKLAQCIQHQKHAFLIVPEQSAVKTEKLVVEKLGNISNNYIEVINFKRLCNRVFRETGGLSLRHIDSGAKKLLMAKTLSEIAPFLKEYASSCENNEFVKKALSAVNELTVCSVSDKAISDACALLSNLPEHSKLKAKLDDIFLISKAYKTLLENDIGDTSDIYEKLLASLEESAFFEGKTVFFDGFYGFTAQEKKIISQIAVDADNVYVSLLYNNKSDDDIFARCLDASLFLEKTAKEKNLQITDIFLEKNMRHKESSALFEYERQFCSENLSKKFDRKTPLSGIEVYKCQSSYEQALCAASLVHRLIRNGAKYSDICISASSLAPYERIISAVFKKSGIPIGTDKAHVLSESALCELILSALEAAFTRKRDAILRYIKTGLSGLTDKEADTFEMYVRTWNITGTLMRSEDDWLMNPEGFVESAPDSAVLETVNTARRKIKSCLDGFEYAIGNSTTLEGCAKAVWNLLCDISKEDGSDSFDDKEGGIYLDLLCKCLDSLVEFGGKMPMTPSVFTRIFRLCCEDYDTGSIPESADCVSFSSAELVRNENVPYVIVLGVNDGEFPSGKDSGGLFSDSEKQILSQNGLALFENAQMHVYDELFLAYSLITNASKGAFLLWSYEGEDGNVLYPSIIAESAKRITHCKENVFKMSDIKDNFAGNEFLFETLYTLENSCKKNTLTEYFSQKPEYKSRLNMLTKEQNESSTLEESTTDFLYKNTINTSYSRLEKFRLCPFSYFCRYTLNLKKEPRAQIGAAEAGNIMHKILEEFVPLAAESKKRGQLITQDEAKDIILSLMEEYFDTFSAGNAQNATKRFRYLYKKLSKQLLAIGANIIREMSKSLFEMCDFELSIAPGADVKPVPLDIDGRTLYIIGKVDRVDKYEKDGKTYIRIIDYKTGSKEFKLDEIKDGLNLQMLLYLYSICKNGKEKYGENLVPAGVIYEMVTSPDKNEKLGYDSDKAKASEKTKAKTSGMLIDDTDILLAMDPSGDGSLIPVKLKDGIADEKQPVMPFEEFTALLEDTANTASMLAKQMCSGEKGAQPYKKGTVDACRFCDMKDICTYT